MTRGCQANKIPKKELQIQKVQTKPIISRTRVCYRKRMPRLTESHLVIKHTRLEVETKWLESYSGVV